MRFIPIGQVVSAHGVRGEIRFRYYSEPGEQIGYPALFAEKNGKQTELTPLQVRRHKGFFLITFKDLGSVEEIAFLLGKELSVREEDLPHLQDDEWYEYQLIGSEVVDEEMATVGRVTDLLRTGAHGILQVRGEGAEFLIPLVEEYVVSVDVGASRIVVKRSLLIE